MNRSFRKRIRSLSVAAAITVLTLSLLPQPAEAAERNGVFNRFFGQQRDADLVERLENLGQFEVLLTALDRAGLTGTVANAEALTIFAPTDAAFAALLQELGITAEELLDSPDLANILLYHVVDGRRWSASLLQQNTVSTLFDERPILVVRESSSILVNDAGVIRANVRAANGFIHVIDGVLLPPEDADAVENIVDVLRMDGRFGTLLAALELTDLDEALSGEAELTLFAPTDEAFAVLLADLGISAEELLANPDLASILLYHVLPGSNGALELLLDGGGTTLQSEDVMVTLQMGGIYINQARVLNYNVSAPNGTIHVIDGVLLP